MYPAGDVQGEDVEGVGGSPIDGRFLRVGKGIARRAVEDLCCPAVELEITVSWNALALAVGDCDPGVATQVEGLARVGHHAQQQLIADEVDLAWADPRPAIAAQRTQRAQMLLVENGPTESGQLRRRSRKLAPVHVAREVVGVGRFELPASWSRTKHSAKLSYTPIGR